MNESGNPKAHGQNLRKHRVSIAGQIYSLTIVTRKRQRIFSDFWQARQLIKVMGGVEQQKMASTLCFVVMPDHAHWLMQLGETKELSCLVQQVKSWSSKRIGKPIWQKGFYDHALRQEEDLKNIARYIIANPLRANLVTNINDYPHWDAIWL
jgi:REP element-mobilizing transposase RayT